MRPARRAKVIREAVLNLLFLIILICAVRGAIAFTVGG